MALLQKDLFNSPYSGVFCATNDLLTLIPPGIPEDEQQRIFLDRVRLPQTSSRTKGYGVGLSVCRRIVEVHRGRIWVVSEPNKGACFHFEVPIWQGQLQGKQLSDDTVLTEGDAYS